MNMHCGLSTIQPSTDVLTATVFESPLGPIGIVESGLGLVAVRIGYSSVCEVAEAFDEHFDPRWLDDSPLAGRLLSYTEGAVDDFLDVCLDTSYITGGAWTLFRETVTNACRSIRYGTTASYGDLARKSGSPRASRAIGGVMSRNNWPIIVPCHRILSSGGGIGGFSAPQGVDFKRRLLELESRLGVGEVPSR